jgi:predicted transposase YbfD/YdcC
VRAHWSIENELHWVLDVAFREDQCRVRKDHGAENLATLRHMALNLLKRERTAKVGVANKRLRAAWDDDYLFQVLAAA